MKPTNRAFAGAARWTALGGAVATLALAAGAAMQSISPGTTSPSTTSATAAAAAESPRSAAPERPNILIFMIDTLRADELGCYGADVTKSPAIDQLAAEGALFENTSAPAGATRPSIASLLTGVPVAVHGAENLNHRIPGRDALVRLPELLAKAGYHTAGVVANPNVASVFGFDKGFDEYHELFAAPQAGEGGVENMTSDAAAVVDRTKQAIQEMPAGRPWFLYALCIDPHDPYTPPAPYETMYDRKARGDRDGSLEAIQKLAQENRKGERHTPAVKRLRSLYRGEITYADAQFARLVAFLRESGTLDRTLVVVTADHGEEFFEHGLRGHSKTVYEEVTHVPLVMRLPRMWDAGLRRADGVDTLDLAATLVMIAGEKPPAFWSGRDLRAPVAPRPVFSAQTYKKKELTAVRSDGWKLIRDEAAGKSEYFYLPQDPEEQKPLAAKDAEAAEKSLTPPLKDFRRATKALRESLLGGEGEVEVEKLPPDVLKALRSLGYVE